MIQCGCQLCQEDPNWMYSYCPCCGGDKDANGDCSNCTDDAPKIWLQAVLSRHRPHPMDILNEAFQKDPSCTPSK